MLARCILSVLTIICIQTVKAQFSPKFDNFSISDYQAGNKNWCVSGTNDGRIFVGNDNGLLEYDGTHWNLWELPNKSKIRSVFVKEDKVFTGAFEEFGYWTKDAFGKMVYSSLTSVDSTQVFDQEYWQIIDYKDAILFRSFTKLFMYKDDKITLIPTRGTITSCDKIENQLYVFTIDEGVLKYVDNGFKKLIYIDLPQGTIVNSIIPTSDGKMLLSTSLHGCFVFDGEKTVSWNTEINGLLKTVELNHCLKLNNGNYAFGTIKNGTYIVDENGSLLFHLHKNGGLINNTVLDQYLSENGQLWLALDNGLSRVDLDSSSSVIYNDVNGNLGAVYDIVSFEGVLYVGSNTGLYFYENKTAKLEFIEGSQGQVWDLRVIGGELFCGHNTGTFTIENKKLKKISDFNGGWVIHGVNKSEKILIQGTYTGLVRYERFNGRWSVKKIKNFNFPSRFIVFEDAHHVWVSHPYKGLYRVSLNEDYSSVEEIKKYDKKGIHSTYNLKVFKLKNTVVFQSGLGWQKYEPIKDSIIEYNYLSDKVGEKAYFISENLHSRIVVKDGDNIFFNKNFVEDNNVFIPNVYFRDRLVSGSERASYLNDSIVGLGLMDGFVLYDINNGSKGILRKPKIEKLLFNGKEIETNSEKINADFKKSDVNIKIGASGSKNFNFEYKLLPNDSDWKKNENGVVEFSNLIDGKYEFLYRVCDDSGRSSEISSFKIIVNPPWYRGTPGYILYFVLTVCVIFTMIVINKRKLAKQQLALKIAFEKEQEIALNKERIDSEKEMNEVKNAALKSELKLKSKQLANTAMSLVKKNEVLMLVKNELLFIKDKFSNQYSYKKLLNQINKSIEHEDEWELFEYNFNQVHKEFFDALKLKFPVLTHKDLKLCAFIKMNLSTKEIAPLLNISIRGVETHRYRLKKKLQLDKEENINEYLNSFNSET